MNAAFSPANPATCLGSAAHRSSALSAAVVRQHRTRAAAGRTAALHRLRTRAPATTAGPQLITWNRVRIRCCDIPVPASPGNLHPATKCREGQNFGQGRRFRMKRESKPRVYLSPCPPPPAGGMPAISGAAATAAARSSQRRFSRRIMYRGQKQREGRSHRHWSMGPRRVKKHGDSSLNSDSGELS